MSKSMWQGVIPAITTPFTEDGQVDHAFLAKHAQWQVEAGCIGMVPLGSLGESATLSFDEKVAVVRTLVKALGDVPVIPGIGSLSTGEAVKLVIVKKDPSLTADQVKAHARNELTGYKQPRYIEFRDELPKTNVGKILRRELRDEVSA